MTTLRNGGHPWRLFFRLLSSLLLSGTVCLTFDGSGSAQIANSSSVSPVALDVIDDNQLIVFDSASKVSEITLNQNSHSSRLLFTMSGGDIPVDMTVGQYNKQLYIFLLTKSPSGKRGTIKVFTYPQGKPTGGIWNLDDVATGMDYDEASGALYFVTLSNGQLFRIPQCSGKIELIGSIPGIGRAGPLGVLPGLKAISCSDVQNSSSKLYIGDVLNGGIFEYDLRSKNLEKVSRYIGSVSSALVYRAKPKTPMLFAADASRHLIVPFSIQNNGTLVAKSPVGEGFLTTPSSIAVLSSFNVVSDLDRHSVVVFSSGWRHLFDIAGRHNVGPNESPW